MIVQIRGVEAIKDKTVDKYGRIVGFADWRGAKVKVLKINEAEDEEEPIIMDAKGKKTKIISDSIGKKETEP